MQELGGSDFEIRDGQPNIKGWKVRTDSGERIGEVDELIFDAQQTGDIKGRLELETGDWKVPPRVAIYWQPENGGNAGFHGSYISASYVRPQAASTSVR